MGLRPFLLVATAGTTDTGTIDPLPQLADVARREDVWFHIDAAYGGFFRLTARGKERLTGFDKADSLTLDPHKTLFMPFGTGALVVRDIAALHAAHDGTGSYLQAMGAGGMPGGVVVRRRVGRAAALWWLLVPWTSTSGQVGDHRRRCASNRPL